MQRPQQTHPDVDPEVQGLSGTTQLVVKWLNTERRPPDHQAILLSNIPCLVLPTHQAFRTVAIYKWQNKSQGLCNFILKVPSKLLNGCSVISAAHCLSLGNSPHVSTKIDDIPVPTEADMDGSRANAKRNQAPQRPLQRQAHEHLESKAPDGKFCKQHERTQAMRRQIK